MIQLKRVYEKAARADGVRFLVDRLWPRGLRKSAVHMDGWEKDAGPGDALRKWFAHDPEKWKEFQRKYSAEPKQRPDAWKPVLRCHFPGTGSQPRVM